MSQGIIQVEYVEANPKDWDATAGALIEEAPLVVAINGREWVTLMCTPVDQEELALGFLLGEGIIRSLDDVALLEICHGGRMADVWLTQEVTLPQRRVITSGCVGGATFEDSPATLAPVASQRRATPAQLIDLMRQLREAGALYQQSRGVHTSAFSDGERLLVVREDVGRHNTLDKIRGACLRQGIDPRDGILLTTGRISSEMLRKAAAMGAPIVVSRTSATSLSLHLAQQLGITLVGYARTGRLRIYADPGRRIDLPASPSESTPYYFLVPVSQLEPCSVG